jgi:hypothetical protein
MLKTVAVIITSGPNDGKLVIAIEFAKKFLASISDTNTARRSPKPKFLRVM